MHHNTDVAKLESKIQLSIIYLFSTSDVPLSQAAAAAHAPGAEMTLEDYI